MIVVEIFLFEIIYAWIIRMNLSYLKFKFFKQSWMEKQSKQKL